MPQIVKEEIEKWFKETYPKGDLYENIYLDKNESGARLKEIYKELIWRIAEMRFFFCTFMHGA